MKRTRIRHAAPLFGQDQAYVEALVTGNRLTLSREINKRLRDTSACRVGFRPHQGAPCVWATPGDPQAPERVASYLIARTPHRSWRLDAWNVLRAWEGLNLYEETDSVSKPRTFAAVADLVAFLDGEIPCVNRWVKDAIRWLHLVVQDREQKEQNADEAPQVP